jgi:gamma-glutamyltranspeptidase/glutathione hydrolase
MVYGSMGGDGQPQTQAAIFTRYILQGIPLQESISRPRWLLGRTWGQTSDSLKLEGRFAPEASPVCGRWGTTWKCWPI